MKDKLKGLFIGILIGVFAMGGTVYAGTNAKLSVVLEKVKFMFNGVEKQTSESIIYKGELYAPVKLISQGFGELYQYDGKSKTAWIGKKDGAYKYLDEMNYARIDGYNKENIRFKDWKYPAGLKFKIADTQYLHGVGAVLNDSWSSEDHILSVDYNLNGKFKKFTGYIGVDDYTKNSDSNGTIVVKGDGQEIYRKDALRGGDVAAKIDIDVTGILKLQIVFETEADGGHIDLVIAEPKLF